MNRGIIRLWLALAIVAVMGASAAAQTATLAPTPTPTPIDYKYCRFDSVSIQLCNQYLPKKLRDWMSTSGLEPRTLPHFLTATEFSPAPGATRYRLIYVSDGMENGLLMMFRPLASGGYRLCARAETWLTAHHVQLRAADVNGDGRKDVIATARGGNPEFVHWAAFDPTGDSLRALYHPPTHVHDTRAPFGVGVAIVDSLARDGLAGVEVWQDDSTLFGQRFLRIVQRYSDKSGILEPESIDTVTTLPAWCHRRRAQN